MAGPWERYQRAVTVPGNIDLHNRPVVKNRDGTISTVRSISANFDGQEVLIPTVSDDGRILSDEDAINLYKRTGRNLGKFNSPEEATAYAQNLHGQQAKEYGPKAGPWSRYQSKSSGAANFSGVTTSADSTVDADGSTDTAIARLISGKKPEPTIMDRVGRELGLGARAMVRGVYDLSGALGGDALNFGESKVTGQPMRTSRESADILADRIGLPMPETGSERIGSDITSALTGTGGSMGVAKTLAAAPGMVASGVGNILAAMPKTQVASAIGSAGAGGIARESGAGQAVQLGASLAGGITPAALAALGPMALRGLMRGGESGRQAMDQTIRDFKSVGAEPSVGQATGNFRTQGTESLLTGGPTSAGVMTRAAEQQADSIGAGLQAKADNFFPNASAERAGRAVERGVRGEDGFIQRTKAVADQLYRTVDQAVPKDSRVQVSNTQQALSALNEPIAGAPNVSKFFQSGRMQGIESALKQDVSSPEAVLTQPGIKDATDAFRSYLGNQGVPKNEVEEAVKATLATMVDNKLPYEALTKLRTLVGGEIENFSLVSDIPRSKWKALYGALSKDMEAAATTPEAKQAWRRANNYFAARSDRIEAIDHVVSKNGGPEKVYNAVMSGTKDGGTTLRAVMQSLPKEGQRALTGAVIKRMGLATPGVQSAAGDTFSAQTFLTNWNKVSPEAKRALFDRHGPAFSADMEKLARVADRIKTGSKVFANPSGTANKGAAITYAGSLAASILSGQLQLAGGLITGGVGANALARAMTSPKFVSWLARNSEIPLSSLPQQIPVLNRIAGQDPEMLEFVELLQQPQNEQANTTSN